VLYSVICDGGIVMSNNDQSKELHAARMRRLDADEADCNRLAIKHKFMHLSALAPSTRSSHAARSGMLFTAEEIKEWVAKDNNGEDCRCTFSLIVVDEAGNPLSSNLIDRISAARDQFLELRRLSGKDC
jgi:hypothetical protein